MRAKLASLQDWWKKWKSVDLKILDITLLSVEEAQALPDLILGMVKEKWWLRSSGETNHLAGTNHFASCVEPNGVVSPQSTYIAKDIAIRPALKIANLKDLGSDKGDVIELAKIKWTVISDDTALCNEPVGWCGFRYYGYNEKDIPTLNDYEKSDCRRFVYRWASSAGIYKFRENVDLKVTDVTLLSAKEALNTPRWLRRARPYKDEQYWWLRSKDACGYNGNISQCGLALDAELGIRPALAVSNLKKLILTAGDGFAFAGHTWTVVSKSLALCDDIVGRCAFSNHGYEVNDYESSEARQFLEKWTEENNITVEKTA